MKHARALGAGALAMLVVACLTTASPSTDVSQKSEPGSGAQWCVPGQSVTCGGPGGCSGYQTCADDGLRYDPCVCPPPPPAPPPVDAGVDAEAMWSARCQAADGAPIMFASTADVPAQLAGQWWLCGGAAELFFPVELTADGHYYALTYADGTFQRNYGPESSGTYQITSVSGVQFEWTFTTTSGSACCGYTLIGELQTTPPGKLRLNGGDYLRLP